jgi:SAM-dependent methyltransferase
VSISEKLHAYYGVNRRFRVLAEHIARLLPRSASLLDVGCGSGDIDEQILAHRSDAKIQGIDVLVRPDTKIPVSEFDGRKIPFPDDSFDGVIFVDVLHHSDDAVALLREARRVARRFVIIKDHRLNGPLAGLTLRFMDDVGNERFGVRLPYNYWPHDRWHEVFRELRLGVGSWNQDLGIYPFGANAVFGRGLHFLARLEVLPDEPSPIPDA